MRTLSIPCFVLFTKIAALHKGFQMQKEFKKMPRKLIDAVTVKLLYMEVPKTVRATAKVSSFERFSPTGPKTLRVNAKVCSFVETSTKLPWLEVLTAVKF